jgi:hypothetical protein
LDGKTLWKEKSQNIGVTLNVSIIMIYIPNIQWIDSHLLELTHGMWVHWNGINHAINEQGLPIHLAADIKVTIHEEFRKGTDGLVRRDFHFIRLGWDNIMSLSTVDKQGWLRGIQLAQDSRVTAPPTH